MLEPAGPTLAYAAPGVGKGTTGAWIAVEALRLGMKPLIYDAERRPREWARRVSGLGGERSRVAYIEPPDLGPTYAGRLFWDSAEAIGLAVRATGADLLIVDSILPSEVEGAIGDQPAPLPDEFKRARIRRERQQATSRLEVDRDVTAWKATMERLDREGVEATAMDVMPITSREIAGSLASIQSLYDEAEPATKHRILQALFEQVEVLGPNEVWLYPVLEAEARGWAAAMSGEFGVEVRKTGRGERSHTERSDLSVPELPLAMPWGCGVRDLRRWERRPSVTPGRLSPAFSAPPLSRQ